MQTETMRRWLGQTASTVAIGVLAASFAGSAGAADVTQQRLQNPQNEPQNWISHHQNYAGHRYSTLNQINKQNVASLKVAFTFMSGGAGGGGRYANAVLEATPLVEDGMLYYPDGWGVVYALDVSNAKRSLIKWRMDPQIDKPWAADVACCGVDNRGVALWKDKVISIALDGRMFAINKANGEIAWERKIADPAVAETLTVAPQVVRDVAIVGPAGAEYAIRGWLDGTDLNTGKQKWRTYTVAGPGEKGYETWKDDWGAYKNGGASIWQQGTFDPDVNLVYWGTGNPGPDYDAEIRPGDNLYTDSLLAMNPDDGQIKWHFQYTPNDPYDYDEIGESQLVDVTIDGQNRKLVVHAARNGFFYGFDRVTGQFLYGTQYVNQINWTPGLDPKTGKPLNYDPATAVQAYNRGAAPRRGSTTTFCPAIQGGKNWYPASYNPVSKVLYVPSTEGCSQNTVVDVPQYPVGVRNGTRKARETYTGNLSPARVVQATLPTTPRGSISAMDVATGKAKAKIQLEYMPYQGLLNTAGGLLFHGDFAGEFRAYDSDTLKELWSFNVGTSIKAPPMTYSVGGKQFVAILVGADPRNEARQVNPMLNMFAPSNMLFVFTL